MRIACLQFAPQVGDVDNNLNLADAVLSKANPQDLDLLVLPELAFSGYNFRSLQHISPFLELTSSGITSLWARTTALKYNCVVHAGYPEKVDITKKWPTSPEYYNSTITVNAEGEKIAHYRKSFLYYTDETWALEGPAGFFGGEVNGLGNVAMGICMDLNPYKFEAPWNAYEFAYHVLHRNSNLVILSMAWLTREDARSFSRAPREPDMDTLSYWMSRLEPIIRAETEGEIIFVFANRCGVEDEVVYAGTSAVLGIHNGEVNVYGILGRGEKELLVVDTSQPAQAKLVSDPNTPGPISATASTVSTTSHSATSDIISQVNDTSSSLCTSPDMDDDDDDDEIYSPNESEFSLSSKNQEFPKSLHQAEPGEGECKPPSSISVAEEGSSPVPHSATSQRLKPTIPTNSRRTEQHDLQEPSLTSHDIPDDFQPGFGFMDASTTLHSASVLPKISTSKKSDSLEPKSQDKSPRPKSTMW